MKQIIIVEDDASLAANVEKVLWKSGDFEVLGNFPSAEAALEAEPWEKADLLLCDLGLPGMRGAELIRNVRSRFPGLLCMAYSLFSDDKSVFDALRAGAQGYLLKGCSGKELIAALHSVLSGESPMNPAIAHKLLENFLGKSAGEGFESLTARETTIVRQLAEGYIYKEVADQLGISPHTVHAHIKKIYGKLHAAGKDEAIRRAKELGYL